jgi:hypothetical protein
LKELKPELSNEEIKQLMLKNRGKNKYVDVKGMTEDLIGRLSEDSKGMID